MVYRFRNLGTSFMDRTILGNTGTAILGQYWDRIPIIWRVPTHAHALG
jgi:hypothetical protein